MPVVTVREPHDVRIDRRTKWGNPFVLPTERRRGDTIAAYRELLWLRVQGNVPLALAQKIADTYRLPLVKAPQLNQIPLEDLADLYGKTLACHCSPRPCHGDVLVKAADWAAHELEGVS